MLLFFNMARTHDFRQGNPTVFLLEGIAETFANIWSPYKDRKRVSIKYPYGFLRNQVSMICTLISIYFDTVCVC